MNFTEEIEKMVELSSKQPNGVYQNTDRIFTGIMERERSLLAHHDKHVC